MWSRITTRLIVLAALLLLAGCSASWKAPIEDRGVRGSHASRTSGSAIRVKFYKVRRGDTLYSIAWRANKDFRSLARWNNIKRPYVIYPGQVLRLVPRGPSSTTRRTTRSEPQVTRRDTASSGKSSSDTKSTTRNTSSGPPSSKLRWRWPASGPLLSSYSSADPTRQGIKIGGKTGQAVRATEAGEVVYSGSGLIGYGRLIIIKHNDTYLSAYGHNQKLLVKEGQKVVRGTQIATMGQSNAGKSMLHFEIRRDGKPINPLGLLPKK